MKTGKEKDNEDQNLEHSRNGVTKADEVSVQFGKSKMDVRVFTETKKKGNGTE